MGRLEKAQTSQESPWPGSSALEHQICKYACKKLPLDSLKSWRLLVCGDLCEDVRSPRLPLQQDLFANVLDRIRFLQAADHLWRKTETSDVHCHAGPHGKFQRACCLEPHLVNTSLATKHGTSWASSWVLDAHHGQASTGAKKYPADPRIVQANKADLDNLAMWWDICQHVSTVNAGSYVQIDCKLQLVLGSSWHHRSWNQEIDRNVI